MRDDIIGKEDFHGAVYYGELEKADLSHEFLEAIEKEFILEVPKDDWQPQGHGIDEVRKIAGEYGIDNINLVKPGDRRNDQSLASQSTVESLSQ